ncbi:MAG TPA: hypothetical protein PKC43_10895 [Phycisphaerales bacterium]|nr:hypothetical protein [Phycisphaerales bacterium]HMP37940.1 hypothetical protein [Phycisphaerales bacterium]
MSLLLASGAVTGFGGGVVSAQNFSVRVNGSVINPGWVLNPGGPASQITIGDIEIFDYLAEVTPVHFLTFRVVARNIDGTAFDVTLTDFIFQTSVPGATFGTEFISVTVTADFDYDPSAVFPQAQAPVFQLDGVAVLPAGFLATTDSRSIYGFLPGGPFAPLLQTAGLTVPGPFSLNPVGAAVTTAGPTTGFRIVKDAFFSITDSIGSNASAAIVLPGSGHATSTPICAGFCEEFPGCCGGAWDVPCAHAAEAFCGVALYQCFLGPGAPENDCVTTPTVLMCGGPPVAFNTQLASPDYYPDPVCSAGSDIWYLVQMDQSGGTLHVEIDTPGFDSVLSLYDLGVSPAFGPDLLPHLLIGCVDINMAGGETFEHLEAMPGHHYLIRVAGFDSGPGPESGTGTITVTCQTGTPCATLLSSFTPDRFGALPADRMQVVAMYDGIGTAVLDIELQNSMTGECCEISIGPINKDDLIAIEYQMGGFEPTGTVTVSGVTPDGVIDGVAFGIYARSISGERWMWRSRSFESGTGASTPNFVGGWPIAWDQSLWDTKLVSLAGIPGIDGSVARRQAQITLSGAQLLSNGTWQIPTGRVPGDVNGDGCVNAADLGAVLGGWTPSCCP